MKTKSDARKDRLAAALRENLKRRKAHARAVAGADSAPRPPDRGGAPNSGPTPAPKAR